MYESDHIHQRFADHAVVNILFAAAAALHHDEVTDRPSMYVSVVQAMHRQVLTSRMVDDYSGWSAPTDASVSADYAVEVLLLACATMSTGDTHMTMRSMEALTPLIDALPVDSRGRPRIDEAMQVLATQASGIAGFLELSKAAEKHLASGDH